MRHRKVAVYYDFQNVRDAIKIDEHYNYALDFIERYCRKVGKIVSMDLFIKSPKYVDEDRIVSFHEKRDWNIIFGERGKDTDTVLVAKALADCFEKKFTAMVLISGDSDFIPLVKKVKQKRKPLYVLCCRDCYRKSEGIGHFASKWQKLPVICYKCNGTGKYIVNKKHHGNCWSCNGTGYYEFN